MQRYRRQRTTHPPLVAPSQPNPGPHYWHRSFRLIRPRKLQAFRSRFFPSSVRSSGRSFSCCAPTLKLKKSARERASQCSVHLRFCRQSLHHFSDAAPTTGLPSTDFLRVDLSACQQRPALLSAFVVQSPCAVLPYRLTMPKSQPQAAKGHRQ